MRDTPLEPLLKRLLRPAWERLLRAVTRGVGIRRVINGTPFYVDSRTRNWFSETYDSGVTALLREKLQPGDEVWNVGANVGLHVLQSCALVGRQGKVVAFEPNPHAVTLLRRNVHLNRFDEMVEVQSVAVGEHAGQIDFYVDGANPMARAEAPNPLLPNARAITVPVVTLDEFASQKQRRPKCIIMDIEGWEIGALKGARTLLEGVAGGVILIAELHPGAWSWSGYSRDDMEALIEKFCLEPVALSGQRDPLSEHGQVWLRYRSA